MQANCIQITFKSEKLVINKIAQEISNPDDVGSLKNSEQPVVYLFDPDHIEVLRQHIDLVKDHTRQGKNIELARYYLRESNGNRIPLIESKFQSMARLLNGLVDLFNRIQGTSTNKPFIIGTTKKIFDKVWGDTEKQVVGVFPVSIPYPTPVASVTRSTIDSDLNPSEVRILDFLNKKYEPSAILEKKYVGNSRTVQLVRAYILSAAKNDSPVLILGNTGTGKEVVARQIHEHCDNHKKGFTAVNCGAISKELLERELFGMEKDALGYRNPKQIGLWEKAGHGTLFLDEIGDLSLDHQVKILRALQENTIRRVAGVEDITVHARIVAATNRNLFAMVKDGTFREDLYYRLIHLIIRTPQLRKHVTDIPIIANFFWKTITKDANALLSPDVVEELCKYSWPGNVRELKLVLNKLYSLFSLKQPTVLNLRDIMVVGGQTPCEKHQKPSAEDERSLHRTRCLQHLNLTEEVMHSCQYKIKDILLKQFTTRASISTIQESLHSLYHEIDLLCRFPQLFHDRKVYSAVYDFKGKITYLFSMLSDEQQEIIEYLKTDISCAMENLVFLIYEETKLITHRTG